MPQNFLGCDREQALLLPPSLREWLGDDHLAWLVLDVVAMRTSRRGLSAPIRHPITRRSRGFAHVIRMRWPRRLRRCWRFVRERGWCRSALLRWTARRWRLTPRLRRRAATR